jgi:hypothetical protein
VTGLVKKVAEDRGGLVIGVPASGKDEKLHS